MEGARGEARWEGASKITHRQRCTQCAAHSLHNNVSIGLIMTHMCGNVPCSKMFDKLKCLIVFVLFVCTTYISQSSGSKQIEHTQKTTEDKRA